MRTTTRLTRRIAAAGAALGLGAALLVLAPSPAAAQLAEPEPFDCARSTIFVAQSVALPTGGIGTQLSKLEAGSGSSTFVPVGPPVAPTYNSIAYDPGSDLIWAHDTTGRLIQVDGNGTVYTTGITAPISNNGLIANDTYYFNAGNEAQLRTLNLGTLALGSIPLSQATGAADLTNIGGLFWGNVAGTQQLVRVNPASGAVDVFAAPFLAPNTGAGAAWTYPNGNLGLSNNGDGTIYQISITNGSTPTPTFALIATSAGPASNGNDGTSCDGLPADLSLTKTSNSPVRPGETITWTLTVTNNGPGDSSGYVVIDSIPAGVTNVASTSPGCTVTTHVTCVGGVLPAGESDVFIVTGTAPGGGPTTLTNNAFVLGNEQDRNTANNSASSDTLVQRVIGGLCRGTGLQLLNLRLGNANNPETPCVTATNSVANVALALGQTFPFPLNFLNNTIVANAVGANTLKLDSFHGAEAHVATAVVNLPLLGLNIQVAGVQTTAAASVGATCSAITLNSTSVVAALIINGKPYAIGANPISIPLPGLGGIYVNQRVVSGGTITSRGVFVDLPGTALDVVIAESKVGIGCV